VVWHHRAHATDCLIVTASHSTGNYTIFQKKHPSFSIFLNTGNSARHQTILMRSGKQCPKDTHSLSLPTLRFNGHFPGESGLAGFTGDKDDGSGGDNWNYKTCKAPVRSLPPTRHHPTFYRPNALPVAKPMPSKYWMENVRRKRTANIYNFDHLALKL